MEHWWNYNDGVSTGENPVPVQHFAPQISHGLVWDGARASAVRGRRLTPRHGPDSLVK